MLTIAKVVVSGFYIACRKDNGRPDSNESTRTRSVENAPLGWILTQRIFSLNYSTKSASRPGDIDSEEFISDAIEDPSGR